MGRTKPIVSKEYIVGLTDGEGCFHVNAWKSSKYRAGYGIKLQFHIKMQKRDRPLLEKVKNTLQCGEVHIQTEHRLNHVVCYRYSASSYKDVLGIIIPFFKKYPLQSVSKRKSFEIFCTIAELVENKSHLTKAGVAK